MIIAAVSTGDGLGLWFSKEVGLDEIEVSDGDSNGAIECKDGDTEGCSVMATSSISDCIMLGELVLGLLDGLERPVFPNVESSGAKLGN
jgi:hypothetical protein